MVDRAGQGVPGSEGHMQKQNRGCIEQVIVKRACRGRSGLGEGHGGIYYPAGEAGKGSGPSRGVTVTWWALRYCAGCWGRTTGGAEAGAGPELSHLQV